MDSKTKVSQVYNNIAQESRLRGRPKNRWWNCVQILKNAKLQTRKAGKKTELSGRSPLRSALHCSAIEEKKKKKTWINH